MAKISKRKKEFGCKRVNGRKAEAIVDEDFFPSIAVEYLSEE